MDLSALRDLARDVIFEVHGVPATVGGVPTRVIWLTDEQDEVPAGGTDMQRLNPRRVLAVPRTDVAAVPRGTIIVVADNGFRGAGSWTVDATADSLADQTRVVVRPTPAP